MSQPIPMLPLCAHRILWLVFGLLAGIGAAHCADWKLREKTDGIRIETRETKNSDIETIRGFMDVPYDPAQVTHTIFSMKAQRKYLVGMAELRLLKKTTNGQGEPERTVYQRNAYPGVSDRDMVVRFTLQHLKGNQVGGSRILMQLMKGAKRPNQSSAVPMEALTGSWTVTPINQGKHSRIKYQCYSEVGGFLPDMFINMGQVDNLREMLGNLRMVLIETATQ